LRFTVVLALLVGLGSAGAAPDRKGGVVRVEHRDPATAPTQGHPDALVTVEYFFVPITQATSRLPQFKALERLHARHPSRVRVIYRVMKLTGTVQLPVAALEAQAQGKFFELMEALHLPRPSLQMTKEQILEMARGIGMDDTRLSAAISDGRYTDTFAANEQRMQRLHAVEKSILFNSRVVKLGSTPSDAELEAAYKAAYERSLELIDQGYEARDLPRVYDEQARRAEQPFVSTGPVDDDAGGDPTEHKLAKPPLDLSGLPTFGKPDARAPQPIVVLCRPNDGQCVNLMRLVQRKVQEVYLDEIRAMWGPFFDVTAHENANELTRLGDVALCAEQIGANPDSLNASPGWRWISRQLDHASRSHGRRVNTETLIDTIANELDIDTTRLSSCRARMAGATLDFIAKARKSGVTRSPALIIGGRIYEGQIDEMSLQKLIEAELAPGMLGETADSMFDRLLFFLSSPKGK
jgi:protein-disulfide isomerase